MSQQNACGCASDPFNLVFACSGAADVGAISDLAARKLSREKKASMCCTAAIAAKIPELMAKTKQAAGIVAIDGCDKECAKNILENGGVAEFAHVQVVALGLEKGRTPVTDENVALVAEAANTALARLRAS